VTTKAGVRMPRLIYGSPLDEGGAVYKAVIIRLVRGAGGAVTFKTYRDLTILILMCTSRDDSRCWRAGREFHSAPSPRHRVEGGADGGARRTGGRGPGLITMRLDLSGQLSLESLTGKH
jgi:hypothetical protein